MPESESFDAFYARTAWNVTSQMHELAGDDSLADHAIREAYAKAYQQWYQVSGYRDSEAWVLGIAKDAYERRRAESAGVSPSSVAEASDSGTWPGFFRPAAEPTRNRAPQSQPFADPDGTLAPPWRGGADGEGASAAAPNYYPAAGSVAADATAGMQMAGADAGTRALADGPPGWFAPNSGTAPPTREIGYGPSGPGGPGTGPYGPDGLGRDGIAGGRGHGGPGRYRPRSGGPSHLATPRNLIVAGVAVAALVIVGITYLSGSGHNAPAPAASQGTSSKLGGNPKPHMLAAGRTGQRSAIPWSLVGPGWAIAEVSTAAPNPAGQASGSGSYTTYLVDPEGGKYQITASSGGTEPRLMAWSGNGQTALFTTSVGTAVGASSYQLLNLRTGQLAPLRLPANVVATGFTRPDGLAILAVRQEPRQFRLQRYAPGGQFQASLASLPRKAGETWPSDGCAAACALSSPDGLTDVWGIAGDEMHAVSNAGGKATRLHVKGSGHPPSCIPLSWWNNTTVLADCAAAAAVNGQRLWLVPDDRSAPTALTPAVSAANGGIPDAWPTRQTTYVTSPTSRQCPSAPSGPGGMDILPLGQAAMTIPGSTGNFSTIVATYSKRLLVLTQTRCPGTSSLVWFSPSTGHSQMAITAPGNEVGVIAAVPFGNGPAAVTNGDYSG